MVEPTKTRIARRSEEMQVLIDKVKKNISDTTYGAIQIKDIEAERIIARKVTEAELI
jgi:hypothetical protein